MKKMLVFFTISLSLILTAGCENKNYKKLVCSSDDLTYISYFNNDNELKKIAVEQSQTAQTKEQFDAGIKKAKEKIKIANELKGINASIKENGLTVTLSMEIDLEKVTDEVLEELSFGFDVKLLLDAKKDLVTYSLEKTGATCE